jgi:hypothetical protein
MNRKATFAKRQRETDLKDHARSKEARRVARKDGSRTGKGPEIAWDQAVYPTADNPDDAPVTNAGAVVPANGAAAAPPPAPVAPPNAASHAKAHEAAAAAAAAKDAKTDATKPGEKPSGAQGSSKLGPRLPSLVPRDDSAG